MGQPVKPLIRLFITGFARRIEFVSPVLERAQPFILFSDLGVIVRTPTIERIASPIMFADIFLPETAPMALDVDTSTSELKKMGKFWVGSPRDRDLFLSFNHFHPRSLATLLF